MKKGRILVGIVFLFFTMVLTVTPCMAAKEKVDPIVLGVALPMGHLGGWGCEKGMRLAVEEINAKGGVNVAGVRRPFKLEVLDTRDLEPGVPISEGLLAVEKLILDKRVDFLVGGPERSEGALAALDLISKFKKVHIQSGGCLSPAYTKKIAENYDKYKYCFRITGDVMELMGDMIKTLEIIRTQQKLDRVFIMVQDVAHARAAGDIVKSGLEKKGWSIVGHEKWPTGASDFSTGLFKAKEAKAQILFSWFDMPESSVMVKQWYDMKLPMLPIGYIDPSLDPNFWKASKGNCAYLVGSCYPKAGAIGTAALPWSGKFVTSYEKKYGIMPEGQWAATGYMGPYVLADAIERAKTVDSEAVIAALEKIDMAGVWGRTKFDPRSHQLISSDDPEQGAVACWAQWIDGKKLAVFPPKIASQQLTLPPWMK